MINHFEFHKEISDKSNLTINLISYCKKIKTNPFNLMPITFFVDLYNPKFEKELRKFVDFFFHL